MTTDDMPRTEQLLRIAQNPDLVYQSQLTGDPVSTSILQRIEDNTPLNHTEEAFYGWLRDHEWFVLNLVCRYAEIAMEKRERWSLAPVWERARWDSVLDLGDGKGDFKINDHHRCYLSRYLNEVYDRPFFMARTVKGEDEVYTAEEWFDKFPEEEVA